MLLMAWGREPTSNIGHHEDLQCGILKFKEEIRSFGVLHLDLQPDNILWNAKLGRALIDFHSAKLDLKKLGLKRKRMRPQKRFSCAIEARKPKRRTICQWEQYMLEHLECILGHPDSFARSAPGLLWTETFLVCDWLTKILYYYQLSFSWSELVLHVKEYMLSHGFWDLLDDKMQLTNMMLLLYAISWLMSANTSMASTSAHNCLQRRINISRCLREFWIFQNLLAD